MQRILLPTLDVNTTHATLTAWHKKIGDTIRVGDVVAELTTDKAAFELESTFDGTLLKMLASEKSILPSGYILALIGAPGENDATAEADNAALLASAGDGVQEFGNSEVENRKSEVGNLGVQNEAQKIQPSAPSPQPSIRATPKARRLAQLHNIDLALVHSQTGAALIDEQTLLPFLPKT